MLGEAYTSIFAMLHIYISSQLIRYIVFAVNPGFINPKQLFWMGGGTGYRGWSLQEVADRHPKRFAFRQCETDSGAVLMWSIWCGRWCINYRIMCINIYIYICMCMYICICVCVCTYVYVCIYIRINISNDEIDHHWWSIGAYVFSLLTMYIHICTCIYPEGSHDLCFGCILRA